MAYTREAYTNLLREIAMSGGDTPKMLELLQKLRDDFDEREGMLRRYGERKDRLEPAGERREEREIREESREDDREDGGERRRAYDALPDEETRDDRPDGGAESARPEPVKPDTVSRADYEELRRKYIDRFFSTPEQAIQAQREDIRKDDNAEGLTFDDLFKDREG